MQLSKRNENRAWSQVKEGVANGTSKNVGLGKFWQDLEISEAFLISLEVSFLHGCIHFFESRNFLPKSLGLGFLTRISASRRVSDFTIRHPLKIKPWSYILSARLFIQDGGVSACVSRQNTPALHAKTQGATRVQQFACWRIEPYF